MTTTLLIRPWGGAMEFLDVWNEYRTYLLVEGDCARSTVVEYGSVLHRWVRALEEGEGANLEEVREALPRTGGSGGCRHGPSVSVAGPGQGDRCATRPGGAAAGRGRGRVGSGGDPMMDLSSMPRADLERYARNLDAALEECERNLAAHRAALKDFARARVAGPGFFCPYCHEEWHQTREEVSEHHQRWLARLDRQPRKAR